MAEVHELTTKDEFLEFVASGKVVVDFGATWCGPCQKIKPIFASLAGDYDGKIKFGKVDVDANEDAAQHAGVTAMPTFVFYLNGARKEDLDLVGASEAKLKEKLEALSKC